MEEGGFWGGMVVGIALTLVGLLLLAGCEERNVSEPNEETCILGGYSIWVSVGPVENGLCLGVDVNGKWKAETLEKVRAGMEGR